MIESGALTMVDCGKLPPVLCVTVRMPRVEWLVTGFPSIAPIFPRCVESG
jgi:hypothetical protein